MMIVNKFFTAGALALSLGLSAAVPLSFAEDSEEIRVCMTVEKLTLGGGFIYEPSEVTIPAGSTAAYAFDFILGSDNYRCTGSVEDSMYISAVRDDETEPDIPEYISEAAGDIGSRGSAQWLGEFDYTNQSGWMCSVNNEFLGVGISDIILNDGDVVRLQFSLYGYGADLGADNRGFGIPALKELADKQALIMLAAETKELYPPDILESSGIYNYAMDVLCTIDSTQDEVNNACDALAAFDPYADTWEEEDEFGSITSVTISDAVSAAAQYVRSAVPSPQFGTIGGEWAVLGLARSGMDVEDGYFDDYFSRMEEYSRQCGGRLSDRKFTEFARAVTALTAIGHDPRDVGGYDLIKPLGDFERVCAQGLNGPVFALIALDSGDYIMPENPFYKRQATREMYVSEILSRQYDNGGFALDNGLGPGCDITAMTITALSGYLYDEKVIEAVDKALGYLSNEQLPDGGFADGGAESSESAAQVLVAMSALNIPQDDERFVKNGRTVYDNLLSFETDGGFAHVKDGEVNEMSAEQALYALCAYDRMQKGHKKLYDMSDVRSTHEADSLKTALKYIADGDEKNAVKMLGRLVKK